MSLTAYFPTVHCNCNVSRVWIQLCSQRSVVANAPACCGCLWLSSAVNARLSSTVAYLLQHSAVQSTYCSTVLEPSRQTIGSSSSRTYQARPAFHAQSIPAKTRRRTHFLFCLVQDVRLDTEHETRE